MNVWRVTLAWHLYELSWVTTMTSAKASDKLFLTLLRYCKTFDSVYYVRQKKLAVQSLDAADKHIDSLTDAYNSADNEKRTTNDGRNRTTKSSKNENARRKGNLQILGDIGSGHHQKPRLRKQLKKIISGERRFSSKLNCRVEI